MKTKKLIAGLVTAAVMTAASTSVIASAADDFAVSISDGKAAAGEEFTLTLDMANIPSAGINGCEFGISYDPSLVSISESGVTLGTLAKDISVVEPDLPSPLEKSVEEDVINIMYGLGVTDSTYFMTGSGTFLTITGTVKKDAADGSKAEFKLVPIDRPTAPGATTTNNKTWFGCMSSDENIVTYDPTLGSGVLTISNNKGETDPPKPTGDIPVGTKYGDVNEDGDVNIADVVKLNLYLLDSKANALTDTAIANADVARDNVIDLSDAGFLMSYTVETIGYEKLGAK